MAADRWLQVQVDVDRQRVGAAEAALSALGALVSWTEGAGDEEILEPAPGSEPLWSRVRVTALLPEDASRAGITALLRAALDPAIDPVFEVVLDRDWDAEWRRGLRPLPFGRRLWVCPEGKACPDPAGVQVVLDPGLAFGTGTHPTTALCLEWLDGLALEGTRVLDYGCGSGILAIASLVLGAAHATGVDIDPQALEASQRNAVRNRCDDRLSVHAPDEMPATFQPCDILVANILSGPLVRLAPALRSRVRDGSLVALSGILADQADDVMAAFRPWVALDRLAEHSGWVLLTGAARRD